MNPARPGLPASVASTVEPVCVAPKSIPIDTCATTRTTNAAPSRRPVETGLVTDSWVGIRQGLDEGEAVVVAAGAAPPQDRSGGRRSRRSPLGF